MAPDPGAAVALFANCLFRASTGVRLAARVVDELGTRPLFATSAVGLPLMR
jgi:hypothetical protein